MRKTRPAKIQYALKTFKAFLNKEQQEAVKTIKENHVTILTGKAGTGKTLVGCYAAIQAWADKEIEHIYITRPQVLDKDEDTGFLPGDLAQKMDPWVQPIWGNFETILSNGESKETYFEFQMDNPVKIVPFGFLRGRTLTNSYVIIDEAQNVNTKQMEKILGRLGRNSKMIFCGDARQCDLKRTGSGLPFLQWIGQKHVNGIKSVELTENHRHPILDEILPLYEQLNGIIPE